MSDIDWEWVTDTAVSYMDGDYRITNVYPELEDDLEDHLLNHNVERCSACGWFVYSYDMVDDDTGEAVDECRECRSSGYENA